MKMLRFPSPPSADSELNPQSCQPTLAGLNETRPLLRWLSRDSAVLDYYAGDVDKVAHELWPALEELRRRRQEEFYSELLLALTRKTFPPTEAKQLWEEIILHKYYMSEKLKRNVGIKVAVLDYLDNHSGLAKDLKLLPEADLDCLLLFVNEDGLTGLYNHRYFQEQLREELSRCKRYNRIFSLLFIDIDHFKEYNDRFGHRQGDVLLREIADFFNLSRRESDTVARYGGDEFAFILPETNKTEARVLAERLQQQFKERFGTHIIPGFSVTIGLSIGVANYPHDGNISEALIEVADQDLYRTKRARRDHLSLSRSGIKRTARMIKA